MFFNVSLKLFSAQNTKVKQKKNISVLKYILIGSELTRYGELYFKTVGFYSKMWTIIAFTLTYYFRETWTVMIKVRIICTSKFEKDVGSAAVLKTAEPETCIKYQVYVCM